MQHPVTYAGLHTPSFFTATAATLAIATIAALSPRANAAEGDSSSTAPASTASAAAEPSPYYIGADLAFTHDSNVFRTPVAQSDNYWTGSLLGGFNQQIGRQRVYSSARVGTNRYSDQTQLNNTSYGVNAGWDWETIEKLSGNVNVGLTQALASLTDSATTPTGSRNVVKTEQFGTTARWGGNSTLALEGGYSHGRVSYSAPEYAANESSDDSGSIGLRYNVSGALSLGTALRASRTVAPRGGPAGTENRVDGRYIDLSANWQASGLTSIHSRLSYARQSNSQVEGRDFSGLTGSITGSYALTGKISLSASLARDAGINGTFFTLNTNAPPATTPSGTTPTPQVTGLSQSSQVTNGASLNATYAATSKIGVTAGAQYRHAKLVDTTTVGGVTTNVEGTDNSRLYSLAVSYAFSRAWLFGCSFAHATRDLRGLTELSYTANTASCSAQLKLQ